MNQPSEFEKQLNKALREAVDEDQDSQYQLIDSLLDVLMNLVVGPLLAWLVFAWAGLLPWSLAGFLSVTAFVFLIRTCILDRGIAILRTK